MPRQGKHTSITIEQLLRKCVFCLVRPEAILGEELKECLDTAVEGDWEEMATR
jgi:hypothetical protein